MMVSDAHVQMCDRIFCRRDETYQRAVKQRDADRVIRNDGTNKVLPLVFDWMRVDDADAKLEALSPQSDELVRSCRIEIDDLDGFK